MKECKFKKAPSYMYTDLIAKCKDWCLKYCNNGTATLKGLRGIYEWREAYIVFCDNTYMTVSKEVFELI